MLGDLSTTSTTSVTFQDILDAAERIRPHVHRTPVITSQCLNDRFDAQLFFKCENLQKTGAFKARGACNALAWLKGTHPELDAVAAHSSGNHAAALARAARLFGMTAHVIMPKDSVPNKIAATKAYGARVTLCAATLAAREEACSRAMAETGATLVHPYDNPQIIAGQGTACLELLDQVPDLDALIVPVGGGGLLAGTLIAAHESCPTIKVYAAEPERVDDTFRSVRSGRIEVPTRIDTIADGLRTSLGGLNFPIIRSLVSEVMLASEQAIIKETSNLLHYLKSVVEPSGAVPIAALAEQQSSFQGKRVGIILSGGNLDLASFPFGA